MTSTRRVISSLSVLNKNNKYDFLATDSLSVDGNLCNECEIRYGEPRAPNDVIEIRGLVNGVEETPVIFGTKYSAARDYKAHY